MQCKRGMLVNSPAIDTNEIRDNAIIQCKQAWDWSELGADGKWKRKPDYAPPGNVVYDQDPGFVNAEKLDFRLKPDARLLRDLPNFKPIPLEKIGLYLDEYRKKLPTDEEIQRYSKTSTDRPLTYDIGDRK